MKSVCRGRKVPELFGTFACSKAPTQNKLCEPSKRLLHLLTATACLLAQIASNKKSFPRGGGIEKFVGFTPWLKTVSGSVLLISVSACIFAANFVTVSRSMTFSRITKPLAWYCLTASWILDGAVMPVLSSKDAILTRGVGIVGMIFGAVIRLNNRNVH